MTKARARHILVASNEACEDLKSQIERGADFAQLANSHSQCPSGKQGGDLGEFSRGDMVREFDEVAFNGELGKVHGPIKTDFGYHLIEITSRTDWGKKIRDRRTGRFFRMSQALEALDTSNGG